MPGRRFPLPRDLCMPQGPVRMQALTSFYDYATMTIVMSEKIPAGEFKAKCLQVIDEVQRLRMQVVITKRGKPVAKLVPLDEHTGELRREHARHHGDSSATSWHPLM